DQPYFDKPLFGYWLVVLASFFTGLNEWALRIPSALCGLAALWATYRLGADIWDRPTARLAAWILLTSQAFLFWGRTGMTDMANLAFITLAV
ncbi:MAG: ArnT family glycosyltransferase, partial [Kiritimatiellia bacterium]